MAKEVSPLGLIALPKDIAPEKRALLRKSLEGLLAFQRTLSRAPKVAWAPSATPIVAVYARAALVGCATAKAPPTGAERLVRAFLSASAAPFQEKPPADVAVEATYARSIRWVEDPRSLEVGTEGVAFVSPGGKATLLMPQVARDVGVDAMGLLGLLREKAGGSPTDARLAAWTIDHVVARTDRIEETSARAALAAGTTDADYAALWIARMIEPDGSVLFALDPRGRIVEPRGELHHARSAIAIDALARHGKHRRAVERARRWLGREIEAGLRSHVEKWPDSRAGVAGTLALACIAGVDVRAQLERLAHHADVHATPWHAAQVALALGKETPPALWKACVEALAASPFAPWTALAATGVGDEATHRRATSLLAAHVREAAPFEGGTTATAIPECGLSAIVAHALLDAPEHADTARRALGFVRSQQLLPGRIPAPVDARLALGGFSATPVNDLLRADIAGHALAALTLRPKRFRAR